MAPGNTRFTQAEEQLSRLLGILEKLRQPGGCPWDRRQTSRTLAPYLVEETHEVLEAIEADDPEWLCEELGDLLLQIVFHAQIHAESELFDMSQVIRGIADKMVRRHPHVFAGLDYRDEQELHHNWERIKAEEKRRHTRHRGTSKPLSHLPSLQIIQKLHARGDARLSRERTETHPPAAELSTALEYLNKLPSHDFRDTVVPLLVSLAALAEAKQQDLEGALRKLLERIDSGNRDETHLPKN